MFNKLLIANRGEIACRIARSARQLGVSPIAVYSDADRNARHVDECERAVYIGEAAAVRSYLCIDKILDAAQTRRRRCDTSGLWFSCRECAIRRFMHGARICFYWAVECGDTRDG